MKTKKTFRFTRMIRNIVLGLTAIMLIVVLVNQALSKYEHKKYPPWGQYVEIDGKKMHVYTKGTEGSAIVLLSGLGTASPVLDFEPLINELANHHKVVVVEPFGYGWSDMTDKERTVENIVGELRSALQKAKIDGPYILMPHSISGIYSMYYANTYPDEIKAIVGIDITLPQAVSYFKEPIPTMFKYMSLVVPSGLARLASYISPSNVLPLADEGTYTDENLKMTQIITSWKAYNKNVVNEARKIKNNIAATKDMVFPPSLPVIIFTPPSDKVSADGKSNLSFYEDQLRKLDQHQLIILKGHHYLHWTQYKQISADVNMFLKNSAVLE